MELSFSAEIIEWRGPAPFFYARLPDDVGAEISAIRKMVTYGWGAIPVQVSIASVAFSTSLFPKDGTYLLPLKDAVRRQVGATVGDVVAVKMTVGR